MDFERTRFALIPAILMLAVGTAHAQGSAPTGVGEAAKPADENLAQRASQAFDAGDWVAAAEAYQRLVASHDDDAVAWHRLGFALHSLGRFTDALPAHERAAKLTENAATPSQHEVHVLSLYDIACAQAMLDRSDVAFESLSRAIAAGLGNEGLIRHDPDLKKLRADPRFERAMDSIVSHASKVAIVIHEGVEMLDFAGPSEVFGAAIRRIEGPCYQVFYVASTSTPVHPNGIDATIVPTYTIENCPVPDVIVVPGGDTPRLLEDTAFMKWFAAAATPSTQILSVCTGAFVLAKTGLLDGKSATTHHSALGGLARDFPKVDVVRGVRYVDHGKVVTAAGVSAGIDAALHLVERDLGKDVAERTARGMEYPWPPASGSESPANSVRSASKSGPTGAR